MAIVTPGAAFQASRLAGIERVIAGHGHLFLDFPANDGQHLVVFAGKFLRIFLVFPGPGPAIRAVGQA